MIQTINPFSLLQALKWLDQLASFECVERVCRAEESPPPGPQKRQGDDGGQPGKKWQGEGGDYGGEGEGAAHGQQHGKGKRGRGRGGPEARRGRQDGGSNADFTVHEYAPPAFPS
jgi:hypothetical protein